MFDYLQQFNNLSSDLRAKVSSPSVMTAISDLEKKYQIDLAIIVMKVMIKAVAIKNLTLHFIEELALPADRAEKLASDMKEKIFFAVADYLGLSNEKRALDLYNDINEIIKKAGLTIADDFLITRFRNILATHLRGVRDKIDTRNSLAKNVKIGGLNLSPEEIDRVMNICVNQEIAIGQERAPSVLTPVRPPSRLDKIVSSADNYGEYDLKSSLDSSKKQVKPPAPLLLEKKEDVKAIPSSKIDASHELPAPAPKTVNQEKLASLSKQPDLPPVKIEKPISQQVLPKTEKKEVPITDKVKLVPPPLTPATSRPTLSSAARPQIHDMKPMPKIMGPIEELKFLDLINFRRLADTPTMAASKIFAKIKLLEKDGYDKMVAGVKAWRQSPVNRLYIRLGQEALVSGQTLAETVQKSSQARADSLDMGEIEAIVKLNSKLIF